MEGDPDLILKNGCIYTLDRDQTWAQAIAIASGQVIYVGSNQGVESYIGPKTATIDLEGKMVVPGFVDAHAHPSQAMDLVSNISLYSLGSVEEYQKAIAEFVDSHPERECYRGGGWTDTLFPNHGPPKELLDALIPDRPVALVSYDGHSLWVNSTALERAHITKDTPDPAGGRIERTPETGEPSGTLRETAANLIKQVIPDYGLEERMNALLAYQEMAVSAGITMVHDAMLDPQSIAAFHALAEGDQLKMRFRGSITLHPDKDLEQQVTAILVERSKNRHPHFQTRAAKIFVDGVIEGGTAYLLEPYAHKPGYRGTPIWEPRALQAATADLFQENIQVHYHVIGDAAARMALDAIEHARKIAPGRDLRPLLTHLQLVEDSDIRRCSKLGVICIVQPFWFKIDDYYRELALPYLGKDRADRQYPLRNLIDAGAIVASASDFPVTIPFDPLIAIQIGITRMEIGSTTAGVLFPQERATLEDLILSFTLHGAYANFMEDQTGSLEVGKQADLIILDRNLFQIPPDEISSTRVLLTMIAGKIVFQDDSFTGGLQ